MTERKPLTAAQRRTLLLLPVGSALVVIGLILAVLVGGSATWFGWALLAAGAALEGAVLFRVIMLSKEDRS